MNGPVIVVAIVVGAAVALYLATRDSVPANEATPPAQQVAFLDVVSRFAEAAEDANPLERGLLRTERGTQLSAALAGSTEFRAWTAEVERLGVTPFGQGFVVLRMPGDVRLMTFQSEEDDGLSRTLLPQSSPVYVALAQLGEGTELSISGTFLPDPIDFAFVDEEDEQTAMLRPSFVIQLWSVASLSAPSAASAVNHQGIQVMGGLDPGEVGAKFREHAWAIVACRQPGAGLENAAVEFEVSRSGRVQRVTLLAEPAPREVEDCLRRALFDFRFNAPAPPSTVRVPLQL